LIISKDEFNSKNFKKVRVIYIKVLATQRNSLQSKLELIDVKHHHYNAAIIFIKPLEVVGDN